MNSIANRSKILAAFQFLVAISTAFSSELASLIKPGMGREIEAGLKPTVVYVRRNATNASSRWAIIDENTTKVDGVSTISKTSLPKNEAVVFDKIALGFAKGTAEGQEGALDYSSTKLPAALRNADLVIIQNGREVVSIPVAELGKQVSPAANEDYYHDLESFQYLVDDQPMQWDLRFPAGQALSPAAAGDVNYIEVRLKGFKTQRKQK
ncbi:hypothetical protein [Salinimicrobium oceani]|uniref:Uncharacterized protein n=1 Tax=Salinimicrobium oceani TaxID=2722702 RepID=A0ABX1D2W4_9FLAO|nr:hypothetical protein [Salinimicrobium oceani]NJW53544.1 hypothetical protein [Salinimicrobium oceani]